MRHLSLTIMIAIAGTAAVAHAQPTPEQQAKRLFFDGNRKLRSGKYKDAAESYRKAYAKVANPKILHNLAVTYALLGRNVDAAKTYEKYLRDPRRDPHKVGVVEKRLRELDQKVAKLSVQVDEKAVAIYVDGERFAGGKQSLRVEPGVHTITANKTGFRTSRVEVTVSAGDTRAVQFQMVRATKSAVKEPTTEDNEPESLAITRSAKSPPGRIGFYARSDIDGNSLGRGAVVTVALAYRASDRLQLGVGGILGASPGAYAGATYALSGGRFRPVVLAGVPVQFADDATLVGIHAAAGLHIALTKSVGALVTAGVEYFASAPDNFERTVFVPSVGLTWRL